MDLASFSVPPERLRWRCDPNRFPFVCTDEVDPLEEFIGQQRALRAMEFGLAMERPGYNMFVTGLSGTGRASAIQSYVERRVNERQRQGDQLQPQDWCYLHNFSDPDHPQIIALPKGLGRTLRQHLDQLMKAVRETIPRAFNSSEFEEQQKAIIEAGQAESQAIFQQIERDAHAEGFLMRPAEGGIQILAHMNGQPLSQEQYLALSDEERQALAAKEHALRERLEEGALRGNQLQQEAGERLKELAHRTAEMATRALFQRPIDSYRNFAKLVQFLLTLHAYTLEHLELFRETSQAGQQQEAGVPQGPGMPRRLAADDPFLPFRVNLLVDNGSRTGPPVIVETNPTFGNLFGKLERRAVMGAYFSDHTTIKAGALSQANGGYLILNAREVLTSPGVWETLKRALRTREVRIEDSIEILAPGAIVPQGIRPEPMPLNVKVIMTGQPQIYQILSTQDEEFWEVFKVRADFDSQIDRNDEHLEAFARFVCSCCGRNGLMPFHRTAVAEVVEHAARVVANQEKLTSRFGPLEDVLIEADYWSRQAGHDMVMGEDVRQAIDEKIYRASLVEERIRELITDGTILVDIAGAVVGQVNGLAVYDLGDVQFGRPSRITAQTFMGRGGVLNIEREVQLSGKSHDKGVLILGGYLGAKYAQDKPLSLAASICFEQSYDGVDGDSASSTELYAILSSLSGLPIQQQIAVTGSVNQKGEVQPIGGVNEKVEGFFAICKEKGLTGGQGVMIPVQNVRNLMLRPDVVDAVEQGLFHVYAVRTIDEGVSLLTGVPAGEREADGAYPAGTVNALVNQRLLDLAHGIRAYNAPWDGAGMPPS